MESRNLSLVLFPTIIRPDFIRLEMSTQMYFILFIQTCIEKCDYLFSTDDNWVRKVIEVISIRRPMNLVCGRATHILAPTAMVADSALVIWDIMFSWSQRTDWLLVNSVEMSRTRRVEKSKLTALSMWYGNLKASAVVEWGLNVSCHVNLMKIPPRCYPVLQSKLLQIRGEMTEPSGWWSWGCSKWNSVYHTRII